MICDFRSDTLTRPTTPMLEAMFNTPVGDDVFGEDPSVAALESYAASLFGMEAALFCPSGTMTNQIAIRVHCKPGDELICDEYAHIYRYEGGGISGNSGVSPKLIPGVRGKLEVSQLEGTINPDDPHFAKTTLVCLENTHNKGGGSCYSQASIEAISTWCKNQGIPLHLDGARIFNAIVATGQQPDWYGKQFQSISICLSKGLGAPVGSLLLGNKAFIHQARRVRKTWGGGMRQAGYLAAAGLFALQNHIDRLKEDHDKARMLETCLSECAWVKNVIPVETNIVIFETEKSLSVEDCLKQLDNQGIKALKFGPNSIRMVCHLDIDQDMMNHTLSTLKKIS